MQQVTCEPPAGPAGFVSGHRGAGAGPRSVCAPDTGLRAGVMPAPQVRGPLPIFKSQCAVVRSSRDHPGPTPPGPGSCASADADRGGE